MIEDQPAVSVRGLVKRYDGRVVVDRLDLRIDAGETFAILGPNGAGKTTTVEILEGYRRADAGEVRVLGLDPIVDGASLRARVGLMLQGGGIYPQARPIEMLRLFARFYEAPRDPRELLVLVGLEDVASTRYRVLSGGQKQRLALALALVGRPELLVLDEPTAGMDPAAKASTRALLGELRASGTTVVLTTHELADVERLADRIAIIDRGRLVALGTLGELSAGAPGSIQFRVERPLDQQNRSELARAIDPRADGDDIVGLDRPGVYRIARLPPSPASIAALAAWCNAHEILLIELRTGGGTLEERYLQLTGDAGSDEAAS